MRLILSALLLITSLSSFAGTRIENWKRNSDPLTLVVRDDAGRFISMAELHSESWSDNDMRSNWTARTARGQFITGYTGTIEKFAVAGQRNEASRLVIRDNKQRFVTWIGVDDKMTSGFESFAGTTNFVVRYEGRIVNRAVAKLERWNGHALPVLVVRDTNDSRNNGKLLAWVPAEKTSAGQVVYRNPENGRFISANN
jgi:hypothetical protein